MNDELYEKLASLRWLLHKRRLRGWAHRGPLADHTQGQGRILAFLKLRDNISTKELSYLLGIAVSSLNELLAKLEKSGHVTREPSEEDKRVMLVRLTEKGRSEEQPEVSERSDIFACLSEAEQGILEDYLDRIIAALEKDLGDSEGDEAFERLREAHARFGHGFRGHGHFHRHGHFHGCGCGENRRPGY